MKKFILPWLLLITVISVMPLIAQTADHQPLYLDPGKAINLRVTDLVSRLTLEEKASLMYHSAPGIKRLQIPEVIGWNQCLHGVCWTKPTTMFPVPIGMAATWDTQLIQTVASTISDEARAIYNLGLKAGDDKRKGLVYRAPVINISRDPRWGRIEECWGEDPYLTSRLGVAFVKGLQGDDPKYLKLVSTLKHFAVNNQEKDRTQLSTVVPERMLMEYWLPHFKACIVEGKAQSIMAAYNAINGVPCAVNQTLLTDILRNEWGFQGYVVSDTGGIERLVKDHRRATTFEETAAQAIKAGCDLDDIEFPKYIPNAVLQGLLSEELVNQAVSRVLKARFQLGEFDPPEMVPFSKITPDVIDSPPHRELALKTARESIVLLSNKHEFLPLDRKKLKSIAIIGPHANQFTTGCKNYSGKVSKTVNPLQGIKNRVSKETEVIYSKGCNFLETTDQEAAIAEAAIAAKKAEAAIVFVGTNSLIEDEGRDRSSITLPGMQEQLIEAVYKANPKTAVVLLNAGPLAIKWAKDKVPAILEAWFAGEEGGNAIADVLFGDYNPSGRLPYTMYESLDQIPPQDEYDITKGFTYMYFKGKTLFPFGHGLSYTKFKFSGMKITPEQTGTDGEIAIRLAVKNTGTRPGDEVVQLYVNDTDCRVKRPIKNYADFSGFISAPGEKKEVSFTIKAEQLSFYDEKQRKFITEPGTFLIMAGISSEDIQAKQKLIVK